MLKNKVADKLHISNQELQQVRNLIFDLGNVVIEVHYERTKEAFAQYGFGDFEKIYTLYRQTDLFNLLETGKISGDEFCNGLRQHGLTGLTNEQMKHAWSMMLGELYQENYDLLKRLRGSFKTYLLSNTNDIHMTFFSEMLKKQYGRNVLPEMFDKIYFSHEVKMRKPDLEIYEYVLKDAGISASETIFIDDLSENIEASRKTGILGYHLEKENIDDLFDLNK